MGLKRDSRRHGEQITMRARELRSSMSRSEAIVWNILKGEAMGVKFRCQHPVGPYFLDFYCPALKLNIEVDGEQHDPDKDRLRDSYLTELSITTMRIPSHNLFDDDRRSEWVEQIWRVCHGEI